MKHNFNYIVTALLALNTAASFAAAPTSGAYITDQTGQYVEDQTSQVLNSLNNVLCHVNAFGGDKMVGKGAYVALVDSNACSTNNRGNNNGAQFQKFIVNSTQAAGQPIVVDVWGKVSSGENLTVRGTATQSPSATLPYGQFRVDYCMTATGGTNCGSTLGFVDASAAGVSFFESSAGNWGGVAASETNQLTVNASSSTTGSGAVSRTSTYTGVGAPANSTVNILFAYDANTFKRNDSAGLAAATKCFDRALANADKTAWNYGLYDSTGAHYDRNGGFPVEYTDAAGVVQNGYIGYWGLWTSGATPANGTQLKKVTYGAAGPTTANYTLMQTGGKLIKHTAVQAPLSTYSKVKFHFWTPFAMNTSVWDMTTQTMVTIPAVTPVLAANSTYGIYWDDVAKNFVAVAKQDANFNMVPLAAPITVTPLEIYASTPWGLFGWMPNSSINFQIDAKQMRILGTGTGAALSAVVVSSETQDIVYPDQFVAVGGLTCLSDCPTAADIAAANAAVPPAIVSPYGVTAGVGWGTPIGTVVNYTLNATTGNLIDPAAAAVTNLTVGSTVWVNSGKMLDAAGIAAVKAANPSAGTAFVAANPLAIPPTPASGGYSQSDFDLSPVWYTWQTSPNQWDQVSLLMSGTTPVKFDPPMDVTFVVPANMAGTQKPYGSFAGSTVTLQYNGFGDLFGIPFDCIDLTTNLACNFANLGAGATWPATWSSKPSFSIPFDATVGFVTGKPTANAAVTTYYVKPQEEEVRFTSVACPASLALPTGTTLPNATTFVDPTTVIGAAPVPANTAPRVIQGEVKY